jgi:hypothetical protein
MGEIDTDNSAHFPKLADLGVGEFVDPFIWMLEFAPQPDGGALHWDSKHFFHEPHPLVTPRSCQCTVTLTRSLTGRMA